MEKKEFYKTVEVIPVNLKPSEGLVQGFKKYDHWELLLVSYCTKRPVYGRIVLAPKIAEKDLIRLEILQTEVDRTVDEMYECYLEEISKEKKEKEDDEV